MPRKYKHKPNPGLWLFMAIMAIGALIAIGIVILEPFGPPPIEHRGTRQ